jgi:CheY-like chemotaxis protein
MNMMRERAEAKNLDLLVNIASGCPQFVRTDPVKLRQVITNLIGNAIKYTNEGTISLELDAAPGAVSTEVILLLDVKDTGIGIAAEDHARIFKPFVQVGRATATKGTGLGLSISRHSLQLLGGTIQVDSTPGSGSHFHVELPVQLAAAAEVAAETANMQHVMGLRPGQPEYRILIVEDQRENWILLQHLLETTGFKVRVAENGLQAVEEFKAWRPHFIWMDVRLPGIDGLEATKRIRRLAAGSKVKIVAVTASAFASQRAEVIAAGCDDFLRKPYRSNEIFECMARYLGVEYVLRASFDATSAGTIAQKLDAEDLVSLSTALRDEIESAVVSLDPARIAVLVSKVSKENGPLGIVLGNLADKLAYSRILQAVQSCKRSLAEHSPAESACDQEPFSDASTAVGTEAR